MKNDGHNTFRVFQTVVQPLWLAALLLVATASAQNPPAMRGPLALDDGSAPVQDLRVAALNRDVVSVAWIAGEGAAGRIYLRHRTSAALGVWQPIQHLIGDIGEQPRDLTLVHDGLARVHLVWTALESGVRRLHYARGESLGVTPAIVPLAFTDAAEAEFPTIAEVPGLGMTVVWEAEGTTSTAIRAMVLPLDKAPIDLGVVSGSSNSAIAPQIVSTNPLRVAWYEIDEIGGRLMINEWSTLSRRWQTAPIQALAGGFPQNGFVVLKADAGALAAGWQDMDTTDTGKIALRVCNRATTDTVTRRWLFNLPAGEHTQPSLGGSPLGRLAVAWRNFTPAGQEVCLRSIAADGTQSDSLVLSPPAQRFAGRVDQATVGDWSIAAWTDVARDGGRGGVYVTELNWMLPSK